MPGGSALIVFEIVGAARRSVASGLCTLHLEAADGRWHALWGATLDERVRDELAAPRACCARGGGRRVRRRHRCIRPRPLRLRGRRARAAGAAYRAAVPAAAGRRASSAVEHFLAGWPSPALPAHAGYPALERRLASGRRGPSRRSRAPEPRPPPRRAGSGRRGGRRRPRAWLEAADDPTLALPASLLRDGSDEVFAFRARATRGARSSPAAADRTRPRERRHRPRGDPPSAVELDHAQVGAFSEGLPRLEQLGVPVRLPREWVATASRISVNLVATTLAGPSSGILTREAIAKRSTGASRSGTSS